MHVVGRAPIGAGLHYCEWSGLSVVTLQPVQQQRRIDLITITAPENAEQQQESATAKAILITARVHPGETASSYVVQGLIDHLTSSDSIAETLRQRYVFYVVPMLNPDGVCLGNYRCSLGGSDLNREWSAPDPVEHAGVYAVRQLLTRLQANGTLIVLSIDMHSHSQRTDAFLYGNVYVDDVANTDRQLLLPRAMAAIATDFDLTSTSLNADHGKAGTSRRLVLKHSK